MSQILDYRKHIDKHFIYRNRSSKNVRAYIHIYYMWMFLSHFADLYFFVQVIIFVC